MSQPATRWVCHRLFLAVVLLAAATLTVSADQDVDPTRLDPTLRRQLHAAEEAPHPLSETDLAVLTPVTVHAQRDISTAILARGGHVGSVVGKGPVVLTARVPLSQLTSLAGLPDVLSISASDAVTPALDESVTEIRANSAWALHHDDLPVTGHGVLIGVVDTGIDLSHPDFRDATGGSRIVAVWDQTRSGSPPTEFDYGTEWRRWQIEAGFATSTDTSGHGTHVAGVAAGAGDHYRGIAPDAELIVVKSLFDTASIIDAWNYIVDGAHRRGEPVVINNSFGAHYRAHDGMADYEIALDALSRPGVIFTTAAGNEGQTAIHASGYVRQDADVTLPIQIAAGYGRDFAEINVWYAGSDRFGVSVQTPAGERFGPVGRGGYRVYHAADDTVIAVDALAAPWPANGDNWVNIFFDAASAEALTGTWRVTLHGNYVRYGRFDAWLTRSPYDQTGFGNYADTSVTVREPSTAFNALSAGAYTTKRCWTASDSQRYCDSYPVGELYPPTGRGPTRDGRKRPDVSAPGSRVFAPRSTQAPIAGPWELSVDTRYAGHVGSSVSTAHLTGVTALMLQVDPTLTAARVRTILRETARADQHTVGGSEYQWGTGKLDALAAVVAAQSRPTYRLYIPIVRRDEVTRPHPTAAPTSTPRPTPTHTPTPWPPGPRPQG